MRQMALVGVAALGLTLGCATAPAARQEQGASTSTSALEGTQQEGAQQEGASREGAVAQAEKKDELICEDVMVTGSRLPKQVCRKKSQVRREREDAQKFMDDKPRINSEFN